MRTIHSRPLVFSLLCTLTATTFLVACERPDSIATTTNTALSTEAPDTFTDGGGHVYRKVKRAVIVEKFDYDQAPKEVKGPNGERTLTFPPDEPIDLKSLTVEELAGLLRGRALRQGYEYEEVSPPIEMAQRILNDLRTNTPPPQTMPRKGLDVPSGDGAQEAQNYRYIIGSDNRTYAGGDRNWPNSANHFVNGSGCSGSMIGSRMLASAAHCFFWNGSWTLPTSFIPAADNGGNPAPWGSFTNFTITLPSGWNGTSFTLDFARVEFSTGVGFGPGWLGTNDIGTGTMQMTGYPGDKPVPQMWTKAGAVTGNSSNRRTHDLDIIPGDSGAGLFTQSGFQVVGIQSTQNWSQTCFFWVCGSVSYWNEATRWTSTLHNFFAATGVWPD